MKAPQDRELDLALGTARGLWEKLLAEVRSRHPGVELEWKHYSDGWRLVLRSKRRNVAYLNPFAGSVSNPGFRASFALNEEAVRAAEASRLPKRIVADLRRSKKLPEGRALRLEVGSAAQLGHVLTVLEIQLAQGSRSSEGA